MAATSLVIAGLGMSVNAAPAAAEFGFADGVLAEFHAPQDVGVLELLGESTGPPLVPELQAGGHPDLTIAFDLNWIENTQAHYVVPDEMVKDIATDLPAGFYGNPQSRPTCTAQEFTAGLGYCPANAQVGVVTVQFGNDPNQGALYKRPIPVYNIKASGEETAVLAFATSNVPTFMKITPRTDGDYGLTATISGATQFAQIYGQRMTIWGDPSDPIHNRLRRGPNGDIGFDEETGEQLGFPSTAPRVPFITAPSRCGEPLTTEVRINSWEQPDRIVSSSATMASLTGCDALRFEPSIAMHVGSSKAGQPSGLAVDLSIPQTSGLDKLGTPPLKDAVVTLPQGVTLSPAAAGGLGACSDAQIGLKLKSPEQCPDSSKIGTVKIVTPVLEAPLEGSVYLGTQQSNDPRSGKMFRMFMAPAGSGIRLKLEGQIEVDPATGQLKASFVNNPQLPFDSLALRIDGSSRAPLVMPPRCGTYAARAELTSWASGSEPVISQPSFTVDSNCANGSGFTPQLEAGTTNPVGGGYSPFTLRVTREDGQQNVSRIEATLPEGVLAKLAGVGVCAEAQAATGDCPASSQVGSTTVGAGAGPSPLYVPQPGKAPTAVYLAGPYKGGPYSLVVKVPAQAGPFDLGTVSVRNALYIDPTTTQVSVKSDPLPQILGGVPISYRDIRVNVDRNDFTLNPTSCDPMSVDGTVVSAQGTVATPSSGFQVANCERLAFKPKLAIKLSGKTHRSAHPALKATLTMPGGGANIEKAQVTLPKTEFLENAHIKTICTRVQYAAKNCPAESIYGYAKAWSPLLDKPLEGPVYLRSSNHKLPDLVASLDGQIHVDLAGRIDAVNARIRNTFEMVPDAAVSKFELTMQGGKKGLLVNNTELCKARPVASVKFGAQNGKTAEANPLVKADCGKARKGKNKRK